MLEFGNLRGKLMETKAGMQIKSSPRYKPQTTCFKHTKNFRFSFCSSTHLKLLPPCFLWCHHFFFHLSSFSTQDTGLKMWFFKLQKYLCKIVECRLTCSVSLIQQFTDETNKPLQYSFF